jgi:hypothetical protein
MVLASGLWSLASGIWLLVSGFWSLASGFWSLVAAGWIQVTLSRLLSFRSKYQTGNQKLLSRRLPIFQIPIRYSFQRKVKF